MATQYEYRARNAKGQLLTGLILADDESAVASFVKNKGMYVVKIKEVRKKEDVRAIFQSFRTVSTRDLSIFCRQFATMLEAGMPIMTALTVLGDQTENSRLKEVVQDAYKKVQEGNTLARALSEHEGIFPEIMTAMVEAGELGGVLVDVMQRLAVHFEKEHRLNEKVKNAMTYPVVVMCLAVVVVIFVLTYILPTFVGMFKQMNAELPWLTQALLNLSAFLLKFWWLLLILLSAAIIGGKYALKRPVPRLWFDTLLLNMPIFGMLIRKVSVARFSRTLASLIRGGVPILSALEVVKKTTGNMVFANALTLSQESIKEGADLSTRLGVSRVFPAMVVQMVAVGEQAGELDRMLDKVADFYESDAEDLVGRLSSMMEPFLIGFLGITVGTIIIAIIVPMFDVITNFGKVSR